MKYLQQGRTSFILLASLLSALFLTAFIGQRTPSFTLKDQFERTWKSSDFQGRPHVFVISDRSGYEYTENWTNAIINRYKSVVRFIPVADVRGVPGFLKSYIQGRFQDEFSYSVLMDWDGIMTTSFKTIEGVPNFIVVGKDGIVRYAIAGTGTKEQLYRLSTRLNEILNK